MMMKLTRQCSDIMRLYSVGRTVENRPLYVMEISEFPGKYQPLKPSVKYIGSIHGNEVWAKIFPTTSLYSFLLFSKDFANLVVKILMEGIICYIYTNAEI